MIIKIFKITIISLLVLVAVLFLIYWQTNIVTGLSQYIINSSLAGVAKIEYKSLSGDLFRNVIFENIKVTLKNGSVFKSNYVKINHGLISSDSDKYVFNSIFFDSLFAQIVTQNKDSLVITEPADTSSQKSELQDILNSAQIDSIFAILPEIKLGDLEILFGKMEFPDEKITLDSIYVKLNAHSDKKSFHLTVDRLTTKWIEKDLLIKRFKFELLGREERITLNKLQFQTPESSVFANMEFNLQDSLWMILNLEDIFLDWNDINKFFVNNEKTDSGKVYFSAHLVGSPAKFSAQFAARGNYSNYNLDSLKADLEYNNGDVKLKNGKVYTAKSKLNFNAELKENTVKTNIYFKNLNTNYFLKESLQTDLNGRISLEFSNFSFTDLQGKVHVLLYKSWVDSFYFDTLFFAGQAEKQIYKIFEPSYLKLDQQSRFNLRGTLSKDLVADFQLSTENNSLASIASIFNIDSTSGNFDGNIFLKGKLSDPELEGFIWIPKFTQPGIVVDSVIMQLQLNKLFSSRQGRAYMSITKCKFNDFVLNESIVSLIIDSNHVVIDTLLFASDKNFISSEGDIFYNSDSVDISLSHFLVNYQKYWIRNEGNIRFAFRNDSLRIKNAKFNAPDQGIMNIAGFWDFSHNGYQSSVILDNIHIDPFQQFIGQQIQLSGVLNGNFFISNPAKSLQLEIAMSGKDLIFNNIPAGDVESDFSYKDGKLIVNNFILQNDSSNIVIEGDVAVQFGSPQKDKNYDVLADSRADLKFLWNKIDFSTYMPLFKTSKKIKGKTTGSLNLTGTMSNPEGFAEIQCSDMVFDKFNSDKITAFLHFNRDSILLESLTGELNGTSFDAVGYMLANIDLLNPDTLFLKRPFELNLHSADDKMVFIGFFLDQVEQIRGPYETQLLIGGTLEKPMIKNGFFKLEKGELVLSRVRNTVSDLYVDATINNSVMTINKLSGYSAEEKNFWQKAWEFIRPVFFFLGTDTQRDGQLKGEGTILLSNLFHPTLDLNLNMKKFYVDYFVENTILSISSEKLHVTGRDTLNLAGALTIESGEFDVDLAKLRKNIYLDVPQVKNERTLAWNLDISIPGSFIIQSPKLDLTNNFQFEILGDLQSSQEPNALNMGITGQMEILSGKYSSFGQIFEIRSGTINFTNPTIINPEVTIQAEKPSGDYTVELYVTGSLDRLQQEIQVRDENGNYLNNLSNQEKLAYLSLGSANITGETLVSAGEGVINTSVETALERGAESLTGLDKVEIKSDQGMVDLRSMKLNNGLQDASISLGKYLTSNLYLEYRSQFGGGTIPAPKLSWEPGNQIGLEYRISKKWSVDSFYSQTIRGNNLIQVSLSWKTTF